MSYELKYSIKLFYERFVDKLQTISIAKSSKINFRRFRKLHREPPIWSVLHVPTPFHSEKFTGSGTNHTVCRTMFARCAAYSFKDFRRRGMEGTCPVNSI